MKNGEIFPLGNSDNLPDEFATKGFLLALNVPSSFAKDKNRLTRTLYHIGKRSGSITSTKNEWIFLHAIRYVGFGMHEAATTSTKIYKLLFYNG